MSESVASISLPEVAQDHLAHLATHVKNLSRIACAAKKTQPGVELASVVASDVGLPKEEVERILATIWNLYQMKRQERLNSAKFIEEVTATLEKETSDEWKSKHLAAWRSSCSDVVSLLDSITDEHPLVIGSKAAALGTAHQNCLVRARVITDVRPVFNNAGDKVVESLIIHTLLVNYFDGTEVRRIQFALDADDVEQIRRMAERAKGKAATLKSALDGLPWMTAVFGETAVHEPPVQESDS
jgi:hypothetical protein